MNEDVKRTIGNNNLQKDIAKYLGAKLDAIVAVIGKSQEVSVELNQEKHPVTPEVVQELIAVVSELKSVMREPQTVTVDLPKQEVSVSLDQGSFAEDVGKVADKLSDAVDKFSDTDISALENRLVEVIGALTEVSKSVKGQKATDLTSTNKLIGGAVGAIKDIHLEEKEVDIMPVTGAVNALGNRFTSEIATLSEVLGSILAVLKKNKMEFPSVFKLDEDQLRSIRSGGQVGSGSVAMLQTEQGTIIRPATEDKQTEVVDTITNKDIFLTLKDLIKAIVYPAYLDRSANQIRAQVTGSMTAVTTVTTVATVTGLTNIDGYQGKMQVINQNIGAWANVVRARIS